MIHHSVILNVLVPKSVSDNTVLRKALDVLSKTNIDTIEFYAPASSIKEKVAIMKEYGIQRVIYLAAGVQKGEKKWLCNTDEKKRAEASAFTLSLLESALDAGCTSFLITSGGIEKEKEKALDSLEKSLGSLFSLTDKMDILLESGDTDVDARQLIGPTPLALSFAKRIRDKHPNFFLTLDTSHIAQLHEEFSASFTLANEVSNHLHLASCILTPGHPLYGDKHPLFKNKDGVYSPQTIEAIYNKVKDYYEKDDRDLTIGVEVIDRSEKEMGSLFETMEDVPWFFNAIRRK